MKNKKLEGVVEFFKQNIWTVATVLIVAFMLYVIGHNLIHAVETRYEISLLETEREGYQQSITRDSTLLKSLESDANLEQYARERYRMQRKNEEIFLFE